uniref:Uncharacterized protein n=1 Tax=viral metagenome TaxID=1070528 RepID=A0A6M3KV35_9ZZZZ
MKENKVKIIADINSIYSGNVEEIKDLMLQLADTGIDAITLQWYLPKNDSEEERAKRVTERELYMLKAFTDLANIEFIPLINYYQTMDSVTLNILKQLEVKNYLCFLDDGRVYMEDTGWAEEKKFFTANTIPISSFPTFDYLNYLGFIDRIDGITASIIVMCKGANYIVKAVVDENSKECKGGIGFGELKELCDFRTSIERILV